MLAQRSFFQSVRFANIYKVRTSKNVQRQFGDSEQFLKCKKLLTVPELRRDVCGFYRESLGGACEGRIGSDELKVL